MSVEVVCLVEETFLCSIHKMQLHLMVHLVDEIALCGIVLSFGWVFTDHMCSEISA